MPRWFFISLILGAQATLAIADEPPISLESFKTHSRLRFHVDPGVDALWKEVPGGFTLLFKGISLVDLGAPLGAEGAWSKKFTSEIQGRKDARLAQVDFKETLDGLLVTGKWRFEAGDRAPAHPKMERFDFRDPETPAYVVDFWPKPGPTVAEVRESTRKIQETEHLKKSAEEAFRRRDRRIASEKARFEVEDSAPYCERPMDESRDVFLKFHPVRESFDLTTWFATTAPDRNYSYLQPKAPDKDAQYVRLALKLYKKSNFGLVIRTLDFLEKDFPASSYIPEMKFLRANALIKLGADDMAAQVFEQIVRAYSDAPVAMNAMIYLTHRLMKRGQHLAALENFLWLLDKYSVHRLSWVFHLGAAESLLSLRETDRAANEFKWVMANAPDRMAQAEAAARIGDLALIREQYDQALSSYFQSMQAYKVEIVKFPSIHINRAESLYWLGQYDQAKQEYERFLQLFANHPAGWRATYRLGEIASRSGTGANSPDARKWFYQTVNQFPSTPGAVLARIRLIPCGDRGGFSEAGAKRFYQTDAKTFNPINEIMMGRYRDFRGLGEMRMQVSMGRPDLALDVGLAELQANPLSEGKGVIGDTLHALLRKSIFKLLNDGKKYEALVFYTEHKDRMPKVKVEGDLVQSDYILKLSQSAADLGLGTLSQRLASDYRDLEKPTGEARAIASVGIENELKKDLDKFSQAKALWTAKGMGAESEVLALLADVGEESEYSYEREILSAIIDERANRFSSALKHVRKGQLLAPKDADETSSKAERQRLMAWTAHLESKAGDPRVAIEIYRQLMNGDIVNARGIRDDATSILGMPSVPKREEIVLALGELLSGIGRWGEAATAYSKLIESGQPTNQILYAYSRALGRSPSSIDKEKSLKALESLAESDGDDFWRKLARTQLADETGKYKPKKKPAKEGGKP